ncbi:MAG: hypothetical protein HY002_09710 [Candidatus Rokubacteria bacterium]|nr:hypothetical protein [Candidatus Rokubacteria bacterium]
MKIAQTTGSTITEVWTTVEPRIGQAKALEDAAQALATALHTQFAESVALARVYLTVPFDALPAKNRTFVQSLTAPSAGAAPALKGMTPVLSLVGTHGQEAGWNDRRNSKGHAGIPLISAAFVDAIPMIARLLRELGVPLDWIDTHDAQRIVTTVGRAAGLFFVEDAASATDQQGRKIIAAQDFVGSYKIKSVFGTGGAYLGGQILVIVVFCRDQVPRAAAEQFLPLADLFKGKTTGLVGTGKVFAEA